MPMYDIQIDGKQHTLDLSLDQSLYIQLKKLFALPEDIFIRVGGSGEPELLSESVLLRDIPISNNQGLEIFTNIGKIGRDPHRRNMPIWAIATAALLLVAVIGGFILPRLFYDGAQVPTQSPITTPANAPSSTPAVAATIPSPTTNAQPATEPTAEPTATAQATEAPTAAAETRYGDTAEAAIQQIQKDKAVIVGVRFDAPPFGKAQQSPNGCNYTVNDQAFQPTGFDVDMAKELVARWLGSEPGFISIRCVLIDDRLESITSTVVTLGAFALTRTDDRCHVVTCSITYVQDGLGFVLPSNSTVANVCDLAGKKVAVSKGSSADLLFLEAFQGACSAATSPELVYIEDLRVGLSPADAVGDDRAVAFKAIEKGQVDAYSTSVKILKGVLESSPNPNLKVLEDSFAPEDYTLAVNASESGLKQLIDQTLQEMASDGTYDRIYRNWFGCDSVPTNIRYTNTSRPDYMKRTDLNAVENKCPTPPPPVTTYFVRPGKFLGDIALEVYGDWSLYPCIMKANNIPSPNAVPSNTKIVIPAREACNA